MSCGKDKGASEELSAMEVEESVFYRLWLRRGHRAVCDWFGFCRYTFCLASNGQKRPLCVVADIKSSWRHDVIGLPVDWKQEGGKNVSSVCEASRGPRGFFSFFFKEPPAKEECILTDLFHQRLNMACFTYSSRRAPS